MVLGDELLDVGDDEDAGVGPVGDGVGGKGGQDNRLAGVVVNNEIRRQIEMIAVQPEAEEVAFADGFNFEAGNQRVLLLPAWRSLFSRNARRNDVKIAGNR